MKKYQNKFATYESFENRRRFPRLDMNLSVTVIAPDREKFRGVIYDISPDGVQMRYDDSASAKLLHGKDPTEQTLRSMSTTLHFDLAFSKTVAHVNIGATPAYLRSIDDDTIACGMFFSEANLAENKKISDFIFHQLQVSYADMDLKKNDPQMTDIETTAPIHEEVIPAGKQSDEAPADKIISDELEQLVLQMDYPKEQLDPLKDIMNRVLNNLKVIQEITRHIDERINLIEQKISRGVGPR